MEMMEAATRGTIVVVDQSAAAQELMERALSEAGHRVLVTRSPFEALELGRRVRIDVLVADVATLDQDGPGLVRQLSTIQPWLSVLYLEGRGRPDRAGGNNAPVLYAPFSLDELEQAVSGVLAGR
jgi:DNA-binding NtrC family response regulator